MNLPEHEAPSIGEPSSTVPFAMADLKEEIKETLVSAQHPSEPKPLEFGLKPTLVSGAPQSMRAVVMARDAAPPIEPLTQGPRDMLKYAQLNQPVATPAPAEVAPPASTRPMWLTALFVFVIVATGLGAVVAAVLSRQ
jgi:hypothetical protein